MTINMLKEVNDEIHKKVIEIINSIFRQETDDIELNDIEVEISRTDNEQTIIQDNEIIFRNYRINFSMPDVINKKIKTLYTFYFLGIFSIVINDVDINDGINKINQENSYIEPCKEYDKNIEFITDEINKILCNLIPEHLHKNLNNICVLIRKKREEPTLYTLINNYLESLCNKGFYKYDNGNDVYVYFYFPNNLNNIQDLYVFSVNLFIEKYKVFEQRSITCELLKRQEVIDPDMLMALFAKSYFDKKTLPLVSLFTSLSAEGYEKKESCSNILFNMSDTAEEDCLFTFKEPIDFSETNLRIIRKLMELTRTPDLYLVATKQNDKGNKGWILSGAKEIKSDDKLNNRVIIKFNGRLSWSLIEDCRKKINFDKGRYIFEFEKKLSYETTIEEKVPLKYRETVKNVTKIIKEQKHGTVAIIAEKNELMKEINRLCGMNKGIEIESSPQFLDINSSADSFNSCLSLTNIDGAIFIDLSGKCHAIGVIVDGKTIVKGDTGRGARFNSINNYVTWVYHNASQIYCVGIVVSEDGMINIVLPDHEYQQ